jgi:biotin-(acetyl-CoA carboxylase) ligase
MSPPGNLYTTILTKVNPTVIPYLSLVCSYSVVNVIERTCGEVIQMKWINDFFLGKDDKKLGGVLIVNDIIGDKAYSAIGVGVNLKNPPVESATCL